MPSYQEIDINVKVLLDKVEFIMKSFSVQRVNPLDPYAIPEVKSLLDVYYEVKAGVPLAVSVGDEIIEGEVTE